MEVHGFRDDKSKSGILANILENSYIYSGSTQQQVNGFNIDALENASVIAIIIKAANDTLDVITIPVIILLRSMPHGFDDLQLKKEYTVEDSYGTYTITFATSWTGIPDAAQLYCYFETTVQSGSPMAEAHAEFYLIG